MDAMSDLGGCPVDPMAPESIAEGRYRRVAVMGEGGVASVWRYDDQWLGRPVAIKLGRPSPPARPCELLQQIFYKEAAALASMTHPNLIRVYDYGVLADRRPYLVLEHVDGLDLGEVTRGRPLPWELAACVISEVLSALAYINARGVLHLDLKPANVLLEPGPNHDDVRVRVVDLGVAALWDASREDLRLTPDRDRFREVSRFLTVPYCAPEQILGGPVVGPPTDLHAVGVLLYELCCGRPAYRGRGDDLFRAVLAGRRAPFQPENGTPPGIDRVISRLLQRDPWSRYRFAAQVSRQLEPHWSSDRAREAWQHLARSLSWPATTPTARVAAPRALPPPSLLSLQVPEQLGRREEKQRILHAVDRVLDSGRPHALLVRGAAGIGKTHLVQSVAERVKERGEMDVVRVSFDEGGAELAPVLRALEQQLGGGDTPARTIRKTLRRRWPEAPYLADGWVALLGQGGSGGAEAGADVQQPQRRQQLVLELLQRLAHGSPLLLWLENVPRADEAALSLIAKALHLHGEGARILVVATARDEDLPGRALGVRQLETETIRLRPLDRSQLEQLDRELLQPPLEPDSPAPRPSARGAMVDGPGGGGLSPEARDTLWDVSGGNPLFALQQIFSWAAAGLLSWDRDRRHYSVPPEARSRATRATVWEGRLSGIDREALEGAMVATLLANRFERTLFEQLLQKLPGRRASVAQRLIEQRLLLSEGRELVWYHESLREQLAGKLARYERREQLRRATAAFLEQRMAEAPQRSVLLSWVRIALRAAEPGESDRACARLIDDVAIRWRERGDRLHAKEDLELVRHHLPAQLTGPWHRWYANTLLMEREQQSAAQKNALQALEFYRARDARGDVAACYGLLARAAIGQGAYERAEAWIDDALQAYVALGDDAGAAGICLLRTRITTYMSDYRSAARSAERAAEHARRAEDRGLVAVSNWWHAWIAHDRARYEEAADRARAARDVFEAIGDVRGLGQAYFILASVAGQRGDPAEALRRHDVALAHFEQSGDWGWPQLCALLRAWIAVVAGDYAVADETLRRARAAFATMASQNEHCHAWLVGAASALARQEREAADRALDTVTDLRPAEPPLRQIDALLRAWRGRLAGTDEPANAALQRALELHEALELTAWGAPWILERIAPLGWPGEQRARLERWRQLVASR